MNNLLPRLNDGIYIFCTHHLFVIDGIESIAAIREPEAITHILKKVDADNLNIIYSQEWSWISLDYQSDLEMTGLTASFSSALSGSGIPCNVIAGFYHDHIFVPREKAKEALEILGKITI